MSNLFFAFEEVSGAIKDGVIQATLITSGPKKNFGYTVNFTEKSLKDYAANAPKKLAMLRQHMHDKLVGAWDNFRYENKRLKATGTFLQHHMLAKDTMMEVQSGLLKGVSIGGGAITTTKTGPMSMDFDKIELQEASLVLSPRDKEAWIELSDDFEWPETDVKPAKYIFTLPKNTAIFS